MKEFIIFLIKGIVKNPDEVVVTETEAQGETVYSVKVHPDDMGFVIGKEGRNIKSIRNMAKAKAIKDNVRINVVLEENA